MTRYFLDTEFNSFGGAMISLALVRQDGASIYLVDTEVVQRLTVAGAMHPWVAENVIPYLGSVPDRVVIKAGPVTDWSNEIGAFLYSDTSSPPQVIADWPSDIADLCNLLLTGPGESVPMPHQTHFTVLRHIDVYPTDLPGAVQHNAWWDAMALRRWVEINET